MAHDPTPAVWFAVLYRLFIALYTVAEYDGFALDPCDKLSDMLTGCGGTVGAILGLVVGVTPDAHWAFNVAVAVFSNFALVWSLATWFRGN